MRSRFGGTLSHSCASAELTASLLATGRQTRAAHRGDSRGEITMNECNAANPEEDERNRVREPPLGAGPLSLSPRASLPHHTDNV